MISYKIHSIPDVQKILVKVESSKINSICILCRKGLPVKVVLLFL
uniref:Uncharacterized protein n=1 Tax=Myoviridae sp. ctByu2 TaxID=2827668 RepID=A0A8S5S9V0_9CAUD|nr:MAG TPA: hypothetical protein [Myoviridae sp. ctByu2]